jgi:hypothetical protein
LKHIQRYHHKAYGSCGDQDSSGKAMTAIHPQLATKVGIEFVKDIFAVVLVSAV